MVDVNKLQAELDQLRADKAFAEYFEQQHNRALLRRAMWVELRREEIERRRWLREFTKRQMIVGERILLGLYSPNSEVGNP